jgi:DNA-binding transcriptional LysR family regulator
MSKGDEISWDDLRYFLSAAKTKTLAGAARKLGVEHTTIGRRISALERALGAPLVMRGPEGLSLTPLGAQIEPLAEEVEGAVLAIRDLVAQQRAHVRLAVPSGCMALFTTRLAQLRREYPGLSLEIVSGARPVDLKKGEADLAIRAGPIKDRDLVARKLCLSGFSLYGSEAYIARHDAPVNPDDLRGHDIIGFETHLADTAPAKWLEERRNKPKIVLRSREMTDVLAAAASGVGLALLPCMLGDEEPKLRRVTLDVVVTHALSLVYRREARLAAPVRAVIRFVVDVVNENADRIAGKRARRT